VSAVLFDVPGPRARARYRVLGVVTVLFILTVLGWVTVQLGAKGQLSGDKWSPFLTAEIWTEYLLPGLSGTLLAAAISIALALTLGVVLGIGRLSERAPVRAVATTIVEFFRAVPVLLMMFFFYNVYGQYQVFPADQVALAAVVSALTLYNGSVVAELIRSGVGSLPRGQREAGLAVGLTPGQVMRSVLLPQAVTAMLPSIVSQLVVVLKDSALGYVITYEELLRKAEQIGNYKANLIPALIVVAAIFIAINATLTSLAGRLEGRMRRRGTGALPPPGGAPGGVGGQPVAVAPAGEGTVDAQP
jgi:glutamate transport system permease protein